MYGGYHPRRKINHIAYKRPLQGNLCTKDISFLIFFFNIKHEKWWKKFYLNEIINKFI